MVVSCDMAGVVEAFGNTAPRQGFSMLPQSYFGSRLVQSCFADACRPYGEKKSGSGVKPLTGQEMIPYSRES